MNFDLSNTWNYIKCLDWEFINTFAPWASAIVLGLFAYLNYQLLRKDRIAIIKSIFTSAYIPESIYDTSVLNRRVFILNFRNQGVKKVKIVNFCLVIKKNIIKNHFLYLFPNLEPSLMHLNTKLPIFLEEGDSKDIFFDGDFFINLNEDSKIHIFHKNKFITWYRLKTMYFILKTTMGKDIKVKMDKNAIKRLWKQYIEDNK